MNKKIKKQASEESSSSVAEGLFGHAVRGGVLIGKTNLELSACWQAEELLLSFSWNGHRNLELVILNEVKFPVGLAVDNY